MTLLNSIGSLLNMKKKSTRTKLRLAWSAPKIELISEEKGRELKELIRQITQYGENARRKLQQEEEPDLPPAA